MRAGRSRLPSFSVRATFYGDLVPPVSGFDQDGSKRTVSRTFRVGTERPRSFAGQRNACEKHYGQAQGVAHVPALHPL